MLDSTRLFFRTRFGVAIVLPLLAFAASHVAFVPSAFAQTDTDRAAARELFFDGVKKQEAGKYQDALDRFQRAQAVFSAPTHLLHIAECQAALNRLVEAGETYRQLAITPIPDTAPAAFKSAKDQAQAELAQLEPRIPQLKVEVKPSNAPSLVVQIDGVNTNVALVGVARPINPGTHDIVVSATGFSKTEQQVTVREREQKTVAIVLPPTSGVVYTAPPPPLPPTENTTQQPPPPVMAPPPPPMVEAQLPNYGPSYSRTGFIIGARLGVALPAGTLPVANGSNLTLNVPQLVSAGPALAFDAGFRFARRLYAGFTLEHDFLGVGSAAADTDLASNINSSVTPDRASGTISSSAASTMVGVDFQYFSNPEGFGFFGEAGVGYRALSRTDSIADGSSLSTKYNGYELLLAAGLHFRAGSSLRIIPRVGVSIGSFTSRSVTCTLQFCGMDASSPDTTSNQGQTHAFFFLGIGGYYNVDFGH